MSTLHLPTNRYLAAMKRLRDLILKDTPLRAEDDTSPGNKSTSCTWGLCSSEKEAWPDAQDHLWPDQFVSEGRIAPKYLQAKERCPLDRRENGPREPNGCFYTCQVFSPLRGETSLQDPVKVLQLYDLRIAKTEAVLKPYGL